jgi:hypothetical protein
MRTPGPSPSRVMAGVADTGRADEWPLRFMRGQPARIEVLGGGARPLGCAVHDAAGALVDSAAGATAPCVLRVLPPRTGTYRVLVRNPGPAPIPYRLVVW